jgi:hypothetical protein
MHRPGAPDRKVYYRPQAALTDREPPFPDELLGTRIGTCLGGLIRLFRKPAVPTPSRGFAFFLPRGFSLPRTGFYLIRVYNHFHTCLRRFHGTIYQPNEMVSARLFATPPSLIRVKVTQELPLSQAKPHDAKGMRYAMVCDSGISLLARFADFRKSRFTRRWGAHFAIGAARQWLVLF